MFPPILPPAPSWYPGHMSRFTRLLPTYLTRTDIVLELRDVRLPLTSVNPAFERIITKWQLGRKKMGAGTTAGSDVLCERIIVLGKKDLVGQWGIEPFRKAMIRSFPEQHVHFTSHLQPRSIKELSQLLISLARRRAREANLETATAGEVNILVVGMPNVGKSTLLNALRNEGIPGPTPKALRTGAHPGLTRALSTRLKLSLDPLIYAFDTPGVMLPFMGHGDRGAERGVKLALIAGIKEGLYDVEALAAYLVYRLWVLNPQYPAYMTLLPPTTPHPSDVFEFLQSLASRLGMLRRGGELDLRRAAVWFIKWWREEGGSLSVNNIQHQSPRVESLQKEINSDGSSDTRRRMGWGFDFEWDWELQPTEVEVQERMEEIIAEYLAKMKEEENSSANVSSTQEKKRIKREKVARRLATRTRTRTK